MGRGGLCNRPVIPGHSGRVSFEAPPPQHTRAVTSALHPTFPTSSPDGFSPPGPRGPEGWERLGNQGSWVPEDFGPAVPCPQPSDPATGQSPAFVQTQFQKNRKRT